jgi:hypothetical protein
MYTFLQVRDFKISKTEEDIGSYAGFLGMVPASYVSN